MITELLSASRPKVLLSWKNSLLCHKNKEASSVSLLLLSYFSMIGWIFKAVRLIFESIIILWLLYNNYTLPPHLFSLTQTVSVLEERLTLTEDKLKECLVHQSQILKDMRASGERQRTESEETDGSPVLSTWGWLLSDGSTNTQSQLHCLTQDCWTCVCVCVWESERPPWWSFSGVSGLIRIWAG